MLVSSRVGWYVGNHKSRGVEQSSYPNNGEFKRETERCGHRSSVP
jgi:hypothetical protein